MPHSKLVHVTQPALLKTKLFFPPRRGGLVPRPRLVERLQKGLRGPLTLIAAPAGYGKTTLMSEWRAGVGSTCPVAWLSLDSGDNDPFRFWGYVLAALETLQDGLTSDVAPLLQSPHLPPAEGFSTALINSLSGFARDFVLVLDDYHLVTTPQIHQSLTFLIDHLPAQMHLVLLTRADPSLPLPRLRVRGQLLELRADDLRFTQAEVAAFLNQVMGLSLSADDMVAMETRTEGWIAGLQMAALSLQGHDAQFTADFIAGFTGSHHYIVDYLFDEVLNRQSDPVKLFLLQTSILDLLSGPLCDALTGRDDGQATLEALERANLFIAPLDDERNWYRYHRLFADVLFTRLRQTQSHSLGELHRRAAEWYQRHGLIAESIRHALAAGDQDYAAQLVEQNALPMLKQSELMTLLNWLKSVESRVPERPWLCIYQAWALVLTHQLDRVTPWLQRAEQQVLAQAESLEGQEMFGHMAAIRGYEAGLRRDTSRAIEFSTQALRQLPEGNLAIRSVVALTLAGAYWTTGDLEAAKRAYAEVRRTGVEGGNINVAVGGLSSLGNLLVVQGQLHQASENYREAIQLATRPEGRVMPVAGAAYTGLSLISYEWNDLEAAREQAQQAVLLCRKWGNAQSLATGVIVLTQALQALGDLDGAQAALREAEALAHSAAVSPLVAGWLEACRAGLWLAQGNLQSAALWARQCAPDTSRIPYLRSILNRAYLRVRLAENELDSVLGLLDRLLQPAEATGQTGTVIELLVLRARALHAKDNLPEALVVLERVLSLARPEDYVRVFVDEGPSMLQLLHHAGSRGIWPGYVARLVAAFEKEPGSLSTKSQPLIEPLSERELEVLLLVAAGKSNQEIADELVLATGTVKRHVSNIFNKLNVESRTRCIARARELQLI